MLNELLAWYLAPWRRIGRAPFNTALVVANLPSMVLSFSGSGDGGPGMFEMAKSLMGGGGIPTTPQEADRANASAQAATDFLSGMMGNGAAAHHAGMADYLDVAVWLLLVPLVMMRLRDTGRAGTSLWVFVAMVYATVALELVSVLTGADFGVMGTGLYLLSGAVVAWLCLAPPGEPARGVEDYPDPFRGASPPNAAADGVTPPESSGKVPADDAYTP